MGEAVGQDDKIHDSSDHQIEWSIAALDRGDARLFVGRNFERYWTAWKKMRSIGSWKNWNWASAILSLIWLGFRRMHGFAAITLGLYAAAMLLIGYFDAKTGGSGGGLMLFIVAASFAAFGLIGDRLYLQHTIDTIRAAGAAEPTADGRAARLRLTGDVSYPFAVVWGIASLALLSIALALGTSLGGSVKVAAPGIVKAPPPAVKASASCSLLPARTAELRRRLDVLRLDYPGTTAWVCSSLKSNPSDKDATALAVRLSASYAACAMVGTAKDCNHVIKEYADILKGAQVLASFARENACPAPVLPAPCN